MGERKMERGTGVGEKKRQGWDRETGEKERVRKTGMGEREREREREREKERETGVSETGVSERETGEKERVTDRGKRGKITNTNRFQRERQG